MPEEDKSVPRNARRNWFRSGPRPDPEGRPGVGTAIKLRRTELGLGRRELAERAGLSYPYVSEIENGKKQGSQASLRAIAEALGLRPYELLAWGEDLEDAPAEAAPSDPDHWTNLTRTMSAPRADSFAMPLAALASAPPPAPASSAGGAPERDARAAALPDEDRVREIVREEIERYFRDR
jgi:transcriptional regulator with XRE-family HTH domain